MIKTPTILVVGVTAIIAGLLKRTKFWGAGCLSKNVGQLV